jgi:choice-of-anchor A domain-containing protein
MAERAPISKRMPHIRGLWSHRPNIASGEKMMFRRIGSKSGTVASKTGQARLRLEQLEDRCVPSATNLGLANFFNGFVFTNFTALNSDVEGRLAVGNNAALTSYGVGASLSNSHGTRNDLIVGHDLVYINGEVFNGNAVYGHAASVSGVGVPNGAVKPGYFNILPAEADLEAKSAKWALYGTNGTITDNWGNLVLTGTDPSINVFNLSASQLQIVWSLTIDAPAGSTVLVNVSGTSANLQYFGMNVNGTDPSRVLFNFNQATALSMQGIGFQGNILAPNAAVNFNNGSVTGTLVANSFTGTGQLDYSAVNINIPKFIPAVISGTVFYDPTGSNVPQPGDPGITPVFVILQGVGNPGYYTTETDANGNYSFTVTQPGTYTLSIVNATGKPYTLVGLNVGTAGGSGSLSTGEITNIPIASATNGKNYDFGLNLPSGGGGGD